MCFPQQQQTPPRQSVSSQQPRMSARAARPLALPTWPACLTWARRHGTQQRQQPKLRLGRMASSSSSRHLRVAVAALLSSPAAKCRCRHHRRQSSAPAWTSQTRLLRRRHCPHHGPRVRRHRRCCPHHGLAARSRRCQKRRERQAASWEQQLQPRGQVAAATAALLAHQALPARQALACPAWATRRAGKRQAGQLIPTH